MKMTRNRPVRVVLCAMVAVGGVMAVAPSSALAANTISQATAQAVNLNLLSGALTVAVSNPPTSATNDGTQSNAQVHAQPLVSLLSKQKLLQVGALSETAEANRNGSSYGCAGIVSPQGQIQIGDAGKSCFPSGNGKGGITIDLGKLTGLGTLVTLAGGDIKITADAITAHAFQKGTDPAILGATLVNVYVQLGNLLKVKVVIDPAPNQDLLSAVLGALSPDLGPLGKAVSNLIKGVVSLTTNYQPETPLQSNIVKAKAKADAAGGDPSVSGLHISLLRDSLAVADLAKVTVGPNAPTGEVDAFSFQNLPVIFGGIAMLIALGYGVRFGVRRVRAFV